MTIDGLSKDFTQEACNVIKGALRESENFNHGYAGTEHIFLSLLASGENPSTKLLSTLGVTYEVARAEVEKVVGGGLETKGASPIPYTPRAKKMLQTAVAEARAQQHFKAGLEDLVLGILSEGEGVAVRVLKNLNINLKECRDRLLRLLPSDRQETSDKLEFVQIATLRLLIDPGNAPQFVIADILSDISLLYRLRGGSGVVFIPQELFIADEALR